MAKLRSYFALSNALTGELWSISWVIQIRMPTIYRERNVYENPIGWSNQSVASKSHIYIDIFSVMLNMVTNAEVHVAYTSTTLKRKCHFDEIFITGCTGSCHFDNFQCSQWWKCHENEYISVSVKMVGQFLYSLICISTWFDTCFLVKMQYLCHAISFYIDFDTLSASTVRIIDTHTYKK